MKKFEIKKIGTGSSTETIYKNIDLDLKKEIANFTCDLNTIPMGFPVEDWTIGEKDGNEYKCINGKNVKYFPIEEVEECRTLHLETMLNKKYLAYKYFKDTYGIIHSYSKNNKLLILDLTDTIKFDGINYELNTMSVNSYYHLFNYGISTYMGIYIKPEVRGINMSLYFTPEGDFINRDYNINLSDFTQEYGEPAVIFDDFKNLIFKEIGEKTLEYKNGKYFTNDVCYTLADTDDIGIRFHKRIRDDHYQYRSGSKIIKKPKKTEIRTKDDLWNHILNTLEPYQKCLLSNYYLEYRDYLNK